MNGPTHPLTNTTPIARVTTAMEAYSRPENAGYIRAVYINGQGQNPANPVVGWASEMSFDIVVNSQGGGPSGVAEGVTFANETPKNDDGTDAYKVVVKFGARVAVMSTGRYDEFWIPWLPYVKPCPGAAARGSGGQNRKKIVPSGSAGGDGGDTSGGGDGVPIGGTGTPGGDSGVGTGTGHGGGTVPP